MIKNQLDDIDIGILELLQKDARITHKAIASTLNLSVTPVHVRVKRLEDEGYIRRYVALIDHKKVDRGLIAYTQVQVKPHTQENLLAFVQEAVKLKEVMECSHLTGKFDFLLKIAVKDMDEYNHLLIHVLSKLPKVDNMESLFVMSQPKNDTAVPLNETGKKFRR
ncbi:MAG: Lrp/AsnC family transcriptional regulator [Bacteroidetes bacterium]|nr:Lrp/AsnC family transcriptional regulator [Bacteroidota bacterium]